MPELARTIVSRLRAYIGNRRRAKRCVARIPFRVRPLGMHANGSGQHWLDGHTLDLSTTGMALNVPAIRIGGTYLVGDKQRLLLQLELPEGPIEIQVMPVRYESLEDHATRSGYLIGAQIVSLDDADYKAYEEFVAQRLHQASPD